MYVIRNTPPICLRGYMVGEAYNLHFLLSSKRAVTSGSGLQKVTSAFSVFNGIVELTDDTLLI